MNRQLIDLIESFAIFGKYASQKDLVVALSGEIIILLDPWEIISVNSNDYDRLVNNLGWSSDLQKKLFIFYT